MRRLEDLRRPIEIMDHIFAKVPGEQLMKTGLYG